MNVLVLGGTTEAFELSSALVGDNKITAVLSLAGRTRNPVLPAIAARRGGFGGVDGLARYLREHGVDALIDATHPFAARISRHARDAAEQAGVARLAIVRPAWRPKPGDLWTEADSMPQAVTALGKTPLRVFLTVGQQELAPFAAAPWHDYLIRSVEPPDPAMLPPNARCIAARGPFTMDGDYNLMVRESIEVIVTKNSGGSATIAKLTAARTLHLPVIMVERPPSVDGETVETSGEALAWLRHRAASSALRGV